LLITNSPNTKFPSYKISELTIPNSRVSSLPRVTKFIIWSTLPHQILVSRVRLGQVSSSVADLYQDTFGFVSLCWIRIKNFPCENGSNLFCGIYLLYIYEVQVHPRGTPTKHSCNYELQLFLRATGYSYTQEEQLNLRGIATPKNCIYINEVQIFLRGKATPSWHFLQIQPQTVWK
jgi:hypothetical protein